MSPKAMELAEFIVEEYRLDPKEIFTIAALIDVALRAERDAALQAQLLQELVRKSDRRSAVRK
jgi:hypothetical protein